MREPAGFREYVGARQHSLVRTAWLLTGDWHSAEDLVQATLAHLWPRWAKVTAAGDPDAYVRKSLVNRFLTVRRRRWRGEIPQEQLAEPAQSGDDFATVDLRDQLGRLLPALPPQQRAVLVLRFFEDLPVDRVADLLGCSAGTVKSQTSKALARLRVAVATGMEDE